MRLRALGETAFDLLVAGGGINGAGIALEAARRGFKVALVEKQDYSAGTTSRSTRLIHGGLRYLEYGELMLVLESLREREWLLRRKPHLVRSRRFIIPVYGNASRSARLIRAGMLLYDLLSIRKAVPRHRMAGKEELRELRRQLDAPGLKGAFLYYDGQVNYPERLVMEAITAARRHGAVVVNHCELLRFCFDGRRVRGAAVRDRLSGAQAEVKAAFTLNVTGPWLEQLDALLPVRRARPLLSSTRGSHLAVGPFPGAPTDAVYLEARADRRPIFIIPWQGLYLIGTTDVPFSSDPSLVRPSSEEIDYLLAEINAMLPKARLGRRSILFSYAGVRALPFEEAAEPGALTRRHIFFDHQEQDGIAGLATILGGKLTTFRALARDVVDRAARKLQRPPATPAPPPVPHFSLWPWQGPPEALLKEVAPLAARHRLEPAQLLALFEKYGAGASRIVRIMEDQPALRAPLSPGSPALSAEVLYAARYEQAFTIGDVLLRRTCRALSADRGEADARAVAELLAKEFSWNSAARDAALKDYAEEIDRTLPTA